MTSHYTHVASVNERQLFLIATSSALSVFSTLFHILNIYPWSVYFSLIKEFDRRYKLFISRVHFSSVYILVVSHGSHLL